MIRFVLYFFRLLKRSVVYLSFMLFKFRARNILSGKYGIRLLKKVLCERFAPNVPSYQDSFWKVNLPLKMKTSYIKIGEEYAKLGWDQIPDDFFSQFKKTGNRSNYGDAYHNRLGHLAVVSVAEIVEGEGRFIDDIVRGLHFFLNVTWWGLPAHYPLDHPKKDLQIVDLYNAETAGLLAWCCFFFKNVLPTELVEHVKGEIDRRMIVPARTEGILSWHDRSLLTSNWNPWICDNWLSCVLLSDMSLQTKVADIHQMLKCLDIFVKAYPDDGYCDEGPLYWNRSVGSLFSFLTTLKEATGQIVDIGNYRKLRKMADYIVRVYIGNGYFVNVGDSQPLNVMQINLAYSAALYLNDHELMTFVASRAKETSFFTNPSFNFIHDKGHISIIQELRLLTGIGILKTISQKQPPRIEDFYFKTSQVVISRKNSHFCIAAKGGNNGEHHNHNDIGNFIVFADGAPLLIDLGAQRYTRASFSNERYTMVSTRSSFHNVPIINNKEQECGAKHKALKVKYKKGRKKFLFAFEMRKAYSDGAKVKSWRRIIMADNSDLQINDFYSLKEHDGDTGVVLVSSIKPKVTDYSTLVFSKNKKSYELSYDNKEAEPLIEEVTLKDSQLQASWGGVLYRLFLRTPSDKLNGTISLKLNAICN